MGDSSGCGGLDGLPDDLDFHSFQVSGSDGYARGFPCSQAPGPCSATSSRQPPDVPDFFFPRLDDFATPDAACQMTDLSNSLPRHDTTSSSSALSTQAILAKLDCSDLNSSLSQRCPAPHPANRNLEAELFGAVCGGGGTTNAGGGTIIAGGGTTNLEEAAQCPTAGKPLEPTDVYGRVNCYDGKIVLQLRLLNLSTNFPINVTECWLCRNKVQGGAQMYAHKHSFRGIFQVNDEYIHLIIPEPEIELDKSVFQSTFDGSQAAADFSKHIAATTDLDFREDDLDCEENFSLPYIAQAFGLDDKILDHSSNVEIPGPSRDDRQNASHNSSSSEPNLTSTMSDLYNMCSGSNVNLDTLETTRNSSTHLKKITESKQEKISLHCLQSYQRESSANLNNSSESKESNIAAKLNDAPVIKKPETGARKRKSKAQKKPSVIRMRDDTPGKVPFYPPASSRKMSTASTSRIRAEDPTKSLRTKPQLKPDAPQTSYSSCVDTTLVQRSQKLLDANFNLVKRIIAKTEDVTCKVCQARFGRNISDYRQHMKSEHGYPDHSLFECPVCLKKFSLNKHLVQHVRIHLGVKAFKCDQCGTTYGREESLKRHLLSHGQKRPHVCRICPKAFARAEYLKAHIQAHNRTRHVCHKCGVVCSSKFNLDIHLRKHSEDKPFVCELCSKSFVRSDFLDNHMEVVHKKNKPKCQICGKLFSRKDVLKRHMNIHKDHKAASFDCKFCMRSFTRRDRLLAHKRTHEINSELKCTKCPASFHRREVLLKHQKLHEIREQCRICHKFIKSKEKLAVHLKWHQDGGRTKEPGRHKCDDCGKILARADLLQKHMRRVHGKSTGEEEEEFPSASLTQRAKQFVCDVCSKGFTRSCNLRAHVIKVHSLKSRQEEEDEDDPEELDGLNSALSKSRSNQRTLVDLSSWTSKHRPKSDNSLVHPGPSGSSMLGQPSSHSLLAVSSTPSVLDASKEVTSSWYPRSGSASPAPHLPANLSLPQLSSQHSPINLSAEAITAAAYLLAYPSYLGPYQ